MPAIKISEYPIFVEIIHNGISTKQVDDGFGGMMDVYLITAVHYSNQTSRQWNVTLTDEVGNEYSGSINADEERTLNIPGPRRFDSYPLTYRLSFRAQ